jgi:hypothetical protein
VHWDLGSVAPLLRLAPERRLRVRLRVLLLAKGRGAAVVGVLSDPSILVFSRSIGKDS